MAFKSGDVPKETLDYLASKKRNRKIGPKLVLFAFCSLSAVAVISGVLNITSSPSPDTKPTASSPEAHNATALPYSAKQQLTDARKYMAARDYKGVLMELQGLRSQDASSPEASRLKSKALQENGIGDRKSYAGEYERGLLTEGQDATVRAEGKEARTLAISSILINRPFVYNTENNHELSLHWRMLGFTRVILTDGYNSTWSYKLD